jgi:hypothetical protein
MWKVKVKQPELNPHQVTTDGYLKFFDTNEPYLYSRGVALKKANQFGGKIEKENTVPTIESGLIIISANDLSFEVRELMRMREDFAGRDKDTHIYKGDIFVTMRLELRALEQDDKNFKAKPELISQLIQLSQVCTTEYVLVKDMCFN